MRRFEVAVVGAGVMGAATAHALAHEGISTVLVEQFKIGHRRGSSHGRSRIFRLSYPDEMYVAMAQESLELWRRLERAAAERLLITTGGLDVGARIEENARALERRGAALESIDGREACRRFPVVALPDNMPVLFQPDSGIVLADASVAACARLAAEGGATVVEECPVESLEPDGGRVNLRTEGGTISADVAVVTAGGWARELLRPLGIELPVRPTRETVAYFELQAQLPTLVEWGEPAVYALPSPGQGIKVGRHIAGPTADPTKDGEVDPAAVEPVTEWVRTRFPAVARVPHHAETCIYTNTDDERFILERHGEVVVGSPCSGHGFKFAPLIGRRLARLAVGR